MSQEKKLADYATGTYFIHPKIIEEMRQIQRQKQQVAIEQGEIPSEQQADLASHYLLDQDKLPDEQATPLVPDLANAPTVHIQIVQIQPTQK